MTPSSFKSSRPTVHTASVTLGRKHISRKLGIRQHKVDFPKVWQRFVVGYFDSPAQTAWAFNVNPSTAEKWWEGQNAPSGFIVDFAWRDPDMASHLHAALAGEL